MDYFPAFLDLNGKPCLLVGGGSVAARKADRLLAAGAVLTVVAPLLGEQLDADRRAGRMRVVTREFVDSDVDGQWLVVCATDNSAVQRQVFQAANKAGVFCNAVDGPAHSSYITPAIVDRSPLLVAISSGGTAPVLARNIRARIESLLPAATGRLAAMAGRLRAEVNRRLPTFSSRRAFWERLFAGDVASDVEAGRDDEAWRGGIRLLDQTVAGGSDEGAAWLVGAGPGDPDLLTLKALQVMQRADVIVHDRLVSDSVLALARRDAEFIAVGKTPGCPANTQASITALLVARVKAGQRVCRLKGGDPFIFGRGGEEAEALQQAGLRHYVVPGVTAAAGCAASAGIPLTHRDAAQSVVLVTAHGKDSVDRLDWRSLARDRQTLAVYMGVSRFPDLMRNLIAHGRAAETPIAIIERGTTPEQRIIRGSLGQLTLLARAHKIQAPAMLIIGEVARLGARQISTKNSERNEPADAAQRAIAASY